MVVFCNEGCPTGSAWRYENAIYLGKGKYCAHDLGELDEAEILEALKEKLKECGKSTPEPELCWIQAPRLYDEEGIKNQVPPNFLCRYNPYCKE